LHGLKRQQTNKNWYTEVSLMQFYNYKHYFYVVQEDTADENDTFICMNVGACFTQYDKEVLSAVHSYQHLENKTLNVPLLLFIFF
jgi:hypothetical protein